MGTNNIFVKPLDRVEINYKRELALIQQRQNNLLRDESIAPTQLQKDHIIAQHQKLRELQFGFKSKEIQRIKAVTKVIGTGCECNKPKQQPELEQVICKRTNLSIDVARVIIDFLPEGSTPRPELSAQQKYILQLIYSGSNVFFTGKAG